MYIFSPIEHGYHSDAAKFIVTNTFIKFKDFGDCSDGEIRITDIPLLLVHLEGLKHSIDYVPCDNFTIYGNNERISFASLNSFGYVDGCIINHYVDSITLLSGLSYDNTVSITDIDYIIVMLKLAKKILNN